MKGLREQFLRGVSQHAGEVLIDLLEESIQPRKAEKIQRELEEPCQIPLGPVAARAADKRSPRQPPPTHCGAAIAIELQASLDQADHGRVRPGGVEPRQRGQEMGCCKYLQRFPLHGGNRTQGSASQDLEQNHTEAEDVGALVLIAIPPSLLRGHVLRRAQQVARDGDR